MLAKLETNTNVEMATDAFELAERVDHVVLFTGDGDMKPVVELLKRRGVRITKVAISKGASQMISGELRRAADNFIDLSDLARLLAREQRAHGNDAQQDRQRAARPIALMGWRTLARPRSAPRRTGSAAGAEGAGVSGCGKR
ncbi:NYN domain-containing protein [Roseivivax sp. CAU 1761]